MGRGVQQLIGEKHAAFFFKQESRGEDVVFHCHGPFSLANYNDLNVLAAAVHDAKGKRTILDLTEVPGIDSSGIGTLATIYKEAMSTGRDLRIVASTPVRLALGLVKIDKLLKPFESLDAALS